VERVGPCARARVWVCWRPWWVDPAVVDLDERARACVRVYMCSFTCDSALSCDRPVILPIGRDSSTTPVTPTSTGTDTHA